MKRIFQLLGRRWKACLVIFALLRCRPGVT